MFRKTTASAPRHLMREARARGRRDGKNQVPGVSWGADSVPYLTQLHRKYLALGAELDLGWEQDRLQSTQRQAASRLREASSRTEHGYRLKRLAKAEAELNQLQAVREGSASEVPMAKFARTRLVTNFFYLPFLLLLIAGEFMITMPALKVLLGESRGSALLVAASVSGLSVGAAHIFGIFLKSQFDRSRPKSWLFSLIFAVVAASTIATVVLISYIRASNSAASAGNLTGIAESWRITFLWLFFTVLQLTFVAVGAALSFMHYSEVETAYLRAKAKVWILMTAQARQELRMDKAGTTTGQTAISLDEQIERQRDMHRSKKILLRAQYEEAAAAYRDANIHVRRDEFDGAHIALRPIPLDFAGTDPSLADLELEFIDSNRR